MSNQNASLSSLTKPVTNQSNLGETRDIQKAQYQKDNVFGEHDEQQGTLGTSLTIPKTSGGQRPVDPLSVHARKADIRGSRRAETSEEDGFVQREALIETDAAR